MGSVVSRGFSGCPETPPPGHDFFYNPVGDTLTGIDLTQTLICDFWKPPLRPTLDTPLMDITVKSKHNINLAFVHLKNKLLNISR